MKLAASKKALLALLAVAALAAGAWYFGVHRLAAAAKLKEAAPDKLFTVKRGDLILGVQLTGNVNAKNKHKLALEAPFNTKLVYIADENAKVSKGDVVARFETEDLQLKIDDLRLELDGVDKELAIAKEEQTMQVSSGEAEVKAAKDAVDMSLRELMKYRKLQGPKEMDTQTATVDEASKTRGDSKASYQELYDSYISTVYTSEDDEAKAKSKAETAKSKFSSDDIKYNNSILDKKIFKRYTYPNKINELGNKYEQSKLDLNKIIVKASASLAQKENAIHKIEARKRKLERDLEKHLSYMPMMQLLAPVDGLIIYGDPDRRWGNPEIKIGMDVRRKEVLLTIPDMSKMVVEMSIPEQYRTKVKKGDKVFITPDSIPGLKIKGSVESIAALPVNQIFWDTSSPKIYRSVVALDKDDPKLVSGMSVQIDVISQTLKDVPYIPVEAVFDEGGKPFVYVKTPLRPRVQPIVFGQANDNYVEIKSGLKEGEEVYLFRPFQSSKGN